MAGICRAATRSLYRCITRGAARRDYGVAAVALDYESEWEVDEPDRDRRGPRVFEAAASWDEEISRGVQWVLMGSPAAKQMYATRLADLLGVPYISMGSLVRQELHPRSSLYKMIAGFLNERELVPEEIIFGLLSKRLEEGYERGENGFILDGIPRTPIQAEILDRITEIDLVVNFKGEDCLVEKHYRSCACAHCGKLFDPSNSTSTDLNPCLATRTQHAMVTRSAAAELEETCSEKPRSYLDQRKLLEAYYKKQNKLLDFNVAGSHGETWQGLLTALHLKHTKAVYSPPCKLTV